MKKLVIKTLQIISPTEKTAKKIDFDEKCTILTSVDANNKDHNRTGKSTILKSLMYGLGCDLTKYQTNWKELSISTIITLTIDDRDFELARIGNKFFLAGPEDLEKQYESVSDLKSFYREFLEFDLKLQRKQGNEYSQGYPGTYWQPFYIDQDKGWDGDYDSFSDVQMYKDWRKEIYNYHLGKDLNEYQKLIEKTMAIKKVINQSNEQHKSLNSYLKMQVSKNKEIIDISLDHEIEENSYDQYIDKIDSLREACNNVQKETRDQLNIRYQLAEKQSAAKRAFLELQKDKKYIEEKVPTREILCPTCGTVHINEISHRYKIFDNIEVIQEKEQYYLNEIKKVDAVINAKKATMSTYRKELANLDILITPKNKPVSITDIVSSKALNKIIKDVSADLNTITKEIASQDLKLKELTKKKTAITKSNKSVDEKYSKCFNTNLITLSVADMDSSSVKKIGALLPSTGNDISRAVIAEFFACVQIIKENNNDIIFPIIIDTPLQQDPCKDNIDSLFRFIKNKSKDKTQLIMASTQIHGHTFEGVHYNFTKRKALLNSDEFDSIQTKYESILLKLYNSEE